MNPYNPYSDPELSELEKLQQAMQMGIAPPPVGVAPLQASPMPAPEPQLPAAEPLNLTVPEQPRQKGMGVSSVTTQGYTPQAQRSLADLHQEMTGQKLQQIETSRQTEETIGQRGIADANARGIEAANQEVYKQRAIEESQRKQQALKQEQDAWSMKKDDPSQAFGGDKWAAVLAAIGVAAGDFSETMGWSRGNSVKDTVNRAIDLTISSQREQKNSRLNVLAARIGDEKAAEAQVRSELHEAAATRIAAQAEGRANQNAIDRLLPQAQEQALLAKEKQAQAYEALLPKQSVTEAPLKPKGGVDQGKRLKEALELDKLLETQGRTPEQRQSVLKAAGYSLPDKGTLTAAEQTNKEQEEKKKEMTPEAKKNLRDRVDGLAESVQAARELDAHVGFKRDENTGDVYEADEKKLDTSIPSAVSQTLEGAANMIPFGGSKGASETVKKMRPEEAKTLERLRDQIVFGQAKADGQGALSEADRGVYRAYIPTDSPLSLQKSTAEQWRKRQQAYKNLSAEDKATVDARLRERGIDPAKEFGSQ